MREKVKGGGREEARFPKAHLMHLESKKETSREKQEAPLLSGGTNGDNEPSRIKPRQVFLKGRISKRNQKTSQRPTEHPAKILKTNGVVWPLGRVATKHLTVPGDNWSSRSLHAFPNLASRSRTYFTTANDSYHSGETVKGSWRTQGSSTIVTVGEITEVEARKLTTSSAIAISCPGGV